MEKTLILDGQQQQNEVWIFPDHFGFPKSLKVGLPWWSMVKTLCLQCRGHRFYPGQGTRFHMPSGVVKKEKHLKSQLKKEITEVPVDPFQMSWIGFGSSGWLAGLIGLGGLINQ